MQNKFSKKVNIFHLPSFTSTAIIDADGCGGGGGGGGCIGGSSGVVRPSRLKVDDGGGGGGKRCERFDLFRRTKLVSNKWSLSTSTSSSSSSSRRALTNSSLSSESEPS